MTNIFLKIQSKAIYDEIEYYPEFVQKEAYRMLRNYVENYHDITMGEYLHQNLSTKIPFCKVIAVGVGVEMKDGELKTVVSTNFKDEKKLLHDLSSLFNDEKFKYSKLIGYNIQEEIFTLFNKFISYDIEVPRPISHPFNCKPWESNVYDILQKVSFGKGVPYLNFNRLCLAYDIDSSEVNQRVFGSSLVGIEDTEKKMVSIYESGIEEELQKIYYAYKTLNRYIS